MSAILTQVGCRRISQHVWPGCASYRLFAGPFLHGLWWRTMGC